MGFDGGVAGMAAEPAPAFREITLLQRKDSKPGKGLGKTTGWVHRLNLKRRGIQAFSGVSYERVDDAGLHIQRNGQSEVLDVDHVIVCAGQLSNRDLASQLEDLGVVHHLIGGAFEAHELDAKHAIRQGSELAAGF